MNDQSERLPTAVSLLTPRSFVRCTAYAFSESGYRIGQVACGFLSALDTEFIVLQQSATATVCPHSQPSREKPVTSLGLQLCTKLSDD